MGLSIGLISGVLWVILGNMGGRSLTGWVRGSSRSVRRVFGRFFGFLLMVYKTVYVLKWLNGVFFIYFNFPVTL